MLADFFFVAYTEFDKWLPEQPPLEEAVPAEAEEGEKSQLKKDL